MSAAPHPAASPEDFDTETQQLLAELAVELPNFDMERDQLVGTPLELWEKRALPYERAQIFGGRTAARLAREARRAAAKDIAADHPGLAEDVRKLRAALARTPVNASRRIRRRFAPTAIATAA